MGGFSPTPRIETGGAGVEKDMQKPCFIPTQTPTTDERQRRAFRKVHDGVSIILRNSRGDSLTTAIYIRDTENAQSADEQREVALDYAAQVLNLDSADVIVLGDTALRARISPSSDDQRLFDLAASGDIERVIVPDSSRIAKNMRDLHERITRLVEEGVAVHIIEAGLRIGEPGADAGPDDQTMLRALGIAAEVSAAVSSERTKEGIAAAKSAGKHIGRPPFGFDSDGNGGLVPNEDFETARTVIERIESGESKRSTARWAGITRATVRNIVDRKELYQSE